VSPVWISVVCVGAATITLKAVGPVLLGQRQLPSWLSGPVALLAPAVLAAFVVTEAVGSHRSIVADARLIGVGAGVIAIALRAPILLVVIVAATAAALARLLT
jgi:branched-subunit amino acid transport protein